MNGEAGGVHGRDRPPDEPAEVSEGPQEEAGPAGVPRTRFHAAYREGAPWQTGRVQPEVERLLAEGWIRGDVLDVGCGTGENAHALSEAHAVVGVDLVPQAIGQARQAAVAGRDISFRVLDALRLQELGRTFDTVLDAGLFHVFSDADRTRYARSLARASHPGTLLHVIVFAHDEPGGWGPRRVHPDELRGTFAEMWEEVGCRRTRYEVRHRPEGVRAWRWTGQRR